MDSQKRPASSIMPLLPPLSLPRRRGLRRAATDDRGNASGAAARFGMGGRSVTKRICEYDACSNSLKGHRKDARFCSDLCRTRYWMRYHPRQPLQRLLRPENGSRRPSRNGLGVKVYLTANLIRELEVRFKAEPASDPLMAKIRDARKRLQRRRPRRADSDGASR